MPRHTVKSISPGKPWTAALPDIPDTWTTLCEAPDFDVVAADVLSGASSRLVAGRLFLMSPVMLRNKAGILVEVEARIVKEDGTTVHVGFASIPNERPAEMGVNAFSLVKYDTAGANGDRLQLRASAAGTVDAAIAVQEARAQDHTT